MIKELVNIKKKAQKIVFLNTYLQYPQEYMAAQIPDKEVIVQYRHLPFHAKHKPESLFSQNFSFVLSDTKGCCPEAHPAKRIRGKKESKCRKRYTYLNSSSGE